MIQMSSSVYHFDSNVRDPHDEEIYSGLHAQYSSVNPQHTFIQQTQ